MHANANYEQLEVFFLVSIAIASVILGLIMIYQTLKERTENPDPNWVPSDPEEISYLGCEPNRGSMDSTLPLSERREQDN